MERLIESRYENLFQTKQLIRSDKLGATCDSDTFSRKELKAIKKEVENSLDTISDMLVQLPANVQDVWLGNFIEYLAATATMVVFSVTLISRTQILLERILVRAY